jgi:hypothetical protein
MRAAGVAANHAPGLMIISTTTDVREGIHGIIDQGEGVADDHNASHFVCFDPIHRKYHELLAVNPKFKPGRSAARNPVMPRPTEQAESRVYIEEPVGPTLSISETRSTTI